MSAELTEDQERLIDEYMAHFFPTSGAKCECDKETGVKCKFNRLTLLDVAESLF